MDLSAFWPIFWSVIGTVATGLATWLTTVIIGWLNTKIKDKKLAQWASQVSTIIFNAVQAVTQEFVDTLKKNGKFDEAAQKEAKERAYKIICVELSADLKSYISENFGDMKEYIMNQIESAIWYQKRA